MIDIEVLDIRVIDRILSIGKCPLPLMLATFPESSSVRAEPHLKVGADRQMIRLPGQDVWTSFIAVTSRKALVLSRDDSCRCLVGSKWTCYGVSKSNAIAFDLAGPVKNADLRTICDACVSSEAPG